MIGVVGTPDGKTPHVISLNQGESVWRRQLWGDFARFASAPASREPPAYRLLYANRPRGNPRSGADICQILDVIKQEGKPL
jgi:hypothetical protein